MLGKSGAGKSVLNGSLIQEFIARNPDGVVRVVDKKTSYTKLADVIGGKVVRFSADDFIKRPYSPFAITKWEKDDIDLVCSFICSAISQVNPQVDLNSQHTEIISEALAICVIQYEKEREMFKSTGETFDPHFTWPDVKEKLEIAAENKGHKTTEVVDELKVWTSSFDETGSLGFLFCSHEKAVEDSNNSNMIVYDLDNIQSENLKSIAAQLVALKVSRDIKKYPLSTQKLVIFEELGVYLEGENKKTEELQNRFVMNITKTVRKLNGIPVGITNAVEDFFTKKGGISFWKQSTRKIFLPFTGEMIASLDTAVKNGEIKLTEADLDIISNLRIVHGSHSEAYLICEQFNKVYKCTIKMPLSKMMDSLLSTSPLVEEKYNTLLDQGHSPIQAIQVLTEGENLK